jgi:hypothetical protein
VSELKPKGIPANIRLLADASATIAFIEAVKSGREN